MEGMKSTLIYPADSPYLDSPIAIGIGCEIMVSIYREYNSNLDLEINEIDYHDYTYE